MSRLPWREQAAVWLAPSQVGLALRRRGWRQALEQHQQDVPAQAGGDQAHAALHTLERLAAVAAPARAHARIVVSNRFVRTALLADGRALRGAAERQVAARELLRGIHGDAVDGWQVAVDGAAALGMPAVALDAGWLALLQRQARHAGLQTLSVRPLLALAAAQAWPRIAGRHAWLLVTEPDGAVLARIATPGGWQSLRSLAFDAALGPQALLPWLARCALLDGLDPADLPLLHVDWRGIDAGQPPQHTAALLQAGWQAEAVPLEARHF
ncbi:hypothetical protein [Pseudorhodoferax sp.]|uniref:hypothetical protein n=1 Tax=Pseudorhodoferax sp. TaxID=1993553 RepID=UPI002DD6459D|nr:hypothetical protein [Pseudorhodoferax sp.]